MRVSRLAWIAAAILAAGAVIVAQEGPPGFGKGTGKGKAEGPGPCERACLEDFVNQYLDALVAHSAFSLPFAPKVKFTENNQQLDLGDGLWNVTTGLGKFKLYVADPQSQQVGFIGTVLENDRPVILALRLKIDNRKVSEMETLVFRGGSGPSASNPVPTGGEALEAAGVPDALLTTAVPEGERSLRQELIAATDAYFDAIERSNASIAPLNPSCERRENGTKMTMACAEQIDAKALSSYQVIYPRRTPIVDEERQLVFGFFTLQQPGDLTTIQVPGKGSRRLPQALSEPAFVELGQVFKMESGKIRRMEGIAITLPYGTPDPYFNDDWRRGKK